MGSNVVTAGATMTGVGSTTLPAQALVGSAANRLELVEIAIINTTSTACIWKLMRISTAGTPGTSLTSAPHQDIDTTTGVVKQAYSSTAPTAGTDFGYRFRIPATVGAGIVRPLNANGQGLIIPATAAAGIGLFIESGTGQLCDVDWTWIEL
jgi:hypothetical protein